MQKSDQKTLLICQSLAKLLAEKRNSQGMSLNKLEAASGLSRQMIALVERGERNPSVESLIRLAIALETSASALLLEAETHAIHDGK